MPKTQSKKDQKKSTQAITIVNNSVLAPEMENHKFSLPKTWVSEKQVMKLIQKTPREHVYSRPAKGGGQWEYVTGVYVKKGIALKGRLKLDNRDRFDDWMKSLNGNVEVIVRKPQQPRSVKENSY